jgi:hypothetical protein
VSQDPPKLDLHIRRFGALGLLEAEDELLDATDETVLEVVKRQLDTMTPLDKAQITINRQRT